MIYWDKEENSYDFEDYNSYDTIIDDDDYCDTEDDSDYQINDEPNNEFND